MLSTHRGAAQNHIRVGFARCAHVDCSSQRAPGFQLCTHETANAYVVANAIASSAQIEMPTCMPTDHFVPSDADSRANSRP